MVLTELFAYMGDIVLYYTDRALNEGFLDTAVERRSLVNLLRLIGYELRPSRPASADLTLLFDPDDPGLVTIPLNAEFDTQIKIDNKPIHFRYLGPNMPLDTSLLPIVSWPDQKQYRRYDALPVVQVDQKIDDEIVGSSDGSAGQQFRLAKKPLIDGSLVLTVDEGGGASVVDPAGNPAAQSRRRPALHPASRRRGVLLGHLRGQPVRPRPSPRPQ